jgi:dipeptidyl aminopeptidase/acylaminoacyl peptidase
MFTHRPTSWPSLLITLVTSQFSLEAREPKMHSVEDFLSIVEYKSASFSPDATKVLINSDASGVSNAYAITVADGKIEPLTNSPTDPIFGISYFPHDERFLYASGKDEHIYVASPDGKVKDLTPGNGVKGKFHSWSQDGKHFYLATNERNSHYFDLYEYRIEGEGHFRRRPFYQNNDGFTLGAVSPDRRFLALHKVHNRLNSDIYLYAVNKGELLHATAHEGNVSYTPQGFTPDSKTLYITTDKGNDFAYLAKINLQEAKTETVKRYDWDVLYAKLSPQGTYLIVAINADGATKLHLYEANSMAGEAMDAMPEGEISSVEISKDEEHMAMYVTSGRMPKDLFYQKLTETDPPKQLTRSLGLKVNPSDLIRGKVVRFQSFDGLEIPGVLYTPNQASKTKKVPALIWMHGGPGGQSRLGYSPLIQYLVNHGYAIYAINNRGSSGYGSFFQSMDDRKHCEGDLDDCVASKKMLAATGIIDPKRIGVIGGSYGGYMVLASLAFRPEAFDVGVNIFGIANWERTLKNIPDFWESYRQSLVHEMGDFNDDDYLRSISPFFHANNIKRPLMIIQGAKDPRALEVESKAMAAILKENKVPVEYEVFLGEGHGFSKKENKIKAYRAIREFLDKHLAKK